MVHWLSSGAQGNQFENHKIEEIFQIHRFVLNQWDRRSIFLKMNLSPLELYKQLATENYHTNMAPNLQKKNCLNKSE